MQFRPNPCTEEDAWYYGDQADELCRAWYPTRGGILYPPGAEISGLPAHQPYASMRGLGAVPAPLALIAIAGTPDGLGQTTKPPLSLGKAMLMGGLTGAMAGFLGSLVVNVANPMGTPLRDPTSSEHAQGMLEWGLGGAFAGAVVGGMILAVAKKRGIAG